MSDASRTHTTASALEKALRERLGLLQYPLSRFPPSYNGETVRVVINAKGCADTVFGMIRGKERSYREVFEKCFGVPLIGGPL